VPERGIVKGFEIGAETAFLPAAHNYLLGVFNFTHDIKQYMHQG